MKKLLLLSALAFAATAGSSFAQSAGTFGYGIELTGNGVNALNNGVATLYALDQGGGTRLIPVDNGGAVTGSPNLSVAWTSSSTAASPTFNLGTFTTSDTLILDGGSLLTYKNTGGDVTGAYVNFRVNSGTSGSGNYSPGISLPFNQNQGNGDQDWASDTVGMNLLSGLAPGTYTLSTYGAATTNLSTGAVFDSNNGSDFGATFTVVVPEPSTWAMMIGGLGALVLFQLRRRQLVG